MSTDWSDHHTRSSAHLFIPDREVSGDGVIGEYPLLRLAQEPSLGGPPAAAGTLRTNASQGGQESFEYEYESCTTLDNPPGTHLYWFIMFYSYLLIGPFHACSWPITGPARGRKAKQLPEETKNLHFFFFCMFVCIRKIPPQKILEYLVPYITSITKKKKKPENIPILEKAEYTMYCNYRQERTRTLCGCWGRCGLVWFLLPYTPEWRSMRGCLVNE